MAKQTFTTGQVLLASQLTSLQQTAMNGGAFSSKTSSYTAVAADAGTAISMTSTSATTITINSGLFAAGDTILITNLGSGACVITAGTATVNTAGSLSLSQYEAGLLHFVSSSSAVFNDYVQAASNPLTTTGDMIYSSSGSTQARLGIGSTSQVLTVSGGIPAWATPTAAGANYSLLNTGGTSLTAATDITVSSISGANKIMVRVTNASAGALSNMTIRFNSNSSGVYARFGGGLTADATYSSNFMFNNGNTGTSYPFGQQANDGSGFISGGILLDGCNSSGVKTVTVLQGANYSGSDRQIHNYYQGIFESSATISSVTISSSVGNFDAGTIYVYTSA